MGTQIEVAIKDLEQHKLIECVEHEVYPPQFETEEGHEAWYYHVTGCPGAGTKLSEDDTHVWFDANKWGPNRGPLLELLGRHEIPYHEG